MTTININAQARIAAVFYLGTIVTGATALMFANGRDVSNLIATICYIGVTALFYYLFKPVNKSLSFIAAVFSLAGCIISALSPYLVLPDFFPNTLVFFGVYCLLIGWLIIKSTFLPRVLGVLMIIGGLGWLTFLFPSLSSLISPFNLAPGIIGESALTFWLLIKGIKAEEWSKLASETA